MPLFTDLDATFTPDLNFCLENFQHLFLKTHKVLEKLHGTQSPSQGYG
jgi:hypothetical protein